MSCLGILTTWARPTLQSLWIPWHGCGMGIQMRDSEMARLVGSPSPHAPRVSGRGGGRGAASVSLPRGRCTGSVSLWARSRGAAFCLFSITFATGGDTWSRAHTRTRA
eukprot:2661580-Prymnesium_polylepis.1